MALPVPNLDDLQFQREPGRRGAFCALSVTVQSGRSIISAIGITLIELFAWMTELMVYRLNKVPDKNYVKFLEMVGVDLMPAAAAEAELTFRLSAPFPINDDNSTQAIVPGGLEVATNAMGEAPEVIFTTIEPLAISGPFLSQLRGEDFHKNYLPRLDVELFYAFGAGRPPKWRDLLFGL